MLRMAPFEYWDITLGWTPAPGEIGGWAEVGAHITKDEQCPTAERAVAMCRQWRHVPHDTVLGAISVRLRQVG